MKLVIYEWSTETNLYFLCVIQTKFLQIYLQRQVVVVDNSIVQQTAPCKLFLNY